MKLNKSAREILERYLLAVRRAITGKGRDDISAEIESFILDHAEERFPDAQEISETQVKEVLQEMGSPRKLAAQFSPQRCLIGSRLYPAFTLVLRIVVAAVAGALTLSFIITSLIGRDTSGGVQILEYLGMLWNGALSAAGFVTLTFAIIERVGDNIEIKELEELEEFDLKDLPELSADEKDPTKAGIIFEIVMGIIGLAFFTYIFSTGGRLPVFPNLQGSGELVRLFTDNFLRFVPVILALAGLDIARNATLLAQGHHSSLTNWWRVCTQGANMALNIFLLRSFPLVVLEGFRSMPFAVSWDFARIASGVNTGLKIVMIISLVGQGIEILRRLYREISNPAG